MTLQMFTHFLALLGLSAALVCPDGGMCEDKNTCCKNTAGRYGCCPLPHAECCSDHLHCCYQGTLCDLHHARCVNKTVSLPWMRRLPAVPQLAGGVKAIVCPDHVSECPDDTTCCKLVDDSWGCCPFKKAVCCEDKVHCCPDGTKCDLAHSRCVSALLQSFPLLQKVPATRREYPVSSVSCPGGKSSCPDGFTCCLLTSGDYGCCPYTEATCCSDHIHCCPADTVCDLEHLICKSGKTQFPLLKKITAVPNDVLCPDKSVCPNQTTCCQMPDGMCGCCPMPDAVCCSDQIHCCPSGTQCDLSRSICVPPQGEHSTVIKIRAIAARMKLVTVQNRDSTGGLSLSWIQKVPALQKEPGQLVSVAARPAKKMCDNQTSCPRDTTCCFMEKTHKWGCCPLPSAVCCRDGNHCCPKGHSCDPHRASCSKGPHIIPWFTKLSATTEPGNVTDIKCDDRSSCPAGTTCCKLQSGQWGCCPLIKAICCPDHEHCCPQGYTCNMKTGTCEKKRLDILVFTFPQTRVVPSKARGPEGNVPCDSVGEFSCSKRDTCCQTSATEWACCPSPRAVCCSDSKHCCPAGFSCDLKSGGCTQNRLTWDVVLSNRRHSVPPGL